jgi:addiction module HigA family antidote
MERHQKTNIHPGLILREDVILPAELSVGQAAELLQVSRVTLSKILNGNGAITPNIALRVEAVFGGKADLWLRMQRGYDLIEEKTRFAMNPPKIRQYQYANINNFSKIEYSS